MSRLRIIPESSLTDAAMDTAWAPIVETQDMRQAILLRAQTESLLARVPQLRSFFHPEVMLVDLEREVRRREEAQAYADSLKTRDGWAR